MPLNWIATWPTLQADKKNFSSFQAVVQYSFNSVLNCDAQRWCEISLTIQSKLLLLIL